MRWYKIPNKFPKNGDTVLAKLDGKHFVDCTGEVKEDTKAVHVLKFRRGMSMSERSRLVSGEVSNQYEDVGGWSLNRDDEMELTYRPRYEAFMPEDEFGNNLVPYCWETESGHTEFGQVVKSWLPMPK